MYIYSLICFTFITQWQKDNPGFHSQLLSFPNLLLDSLASRLDLIQHLTISSAVSVSYRLSFIGRWISLSFSLLSSHEHPPFLFLPTCRHLLVNIHISWRTHRLSFVSLLNRGRPSSPPRPSLPQLHHTRERPAIGCPRCRLFPDQVVPILIRFARSQLSPNIPGKMGKRWKRKNGIRLGPYCCGFDNTS